MAPVEILPSGVVPAAGGAEVAGPVRSAARQRNDVVNLLSRGSASGDPASAAIVGSSGFPLLPRAPSASESCAAPEPCAPAPVVERHAQQSDIPMLAAVAALRLLAVFLCAQPAPPFIEAGVAARFPFSEGQRTMADTTRPRWLRRTNGNHPRRFR